jgi:tetratricopeptide (TPR) repeat protein
MLFVSYRTLSSGLIALIAALHVAAGGSGDDKKPSISIDQIQALVDAEKYPDAVKKGREFLRQDKDPAVYTLVGFSLRKQKKWDEAIKSYKDALAIDGSYGPAKEYLAVAYLNKKDKVKAKALYDDLKKSDPNLATMLKSEAEKLGVKW